jgi:hypothetical protein
MLPNVSALPPMKYALPLRNAARAEGKWCRPNVVTLPTEWGRDVGKYNCVPPLSVESSISIPDHVREDLVHRDNTNVARRNFIFVSRHFLFNGRVVSLFQVYIDILLSLLLLLI